MPDDELERRDYEALLATRRELGPDYEAALVESFADRIERAVEKRTADALWSRDLRRAQTESSGKRQLALGIVSTAAAVPISITLGVTDNLGALLVSWAGIVGVNVAHALQGRHDR